VPAAPGMTSHRRRRSPAPLRASKPHSRFKSYQSRRPHATGAVPAFSGWRLTSSAQFRRRRRVCVALVNQVGTVPDCCRGDCSTNYNSDKERTKSDQGLARKSLRRTGGDDGARTRDLRRDRRKD
jgi:hypothetical protein